MLNKRFYLLKKFASLLVVNQIFMVREENLPECLGQNDRCMIFK